MKVIFFILFELAVSLSSCSGRKTDIKNVVEDPPIFSTFQLTQYKQQSESTCENFYDFLQKFSTDRIFQLKRIVFPVKAIVSDPTDEGMTIKEDRIEKQAWEHLDLTYDSTYVTREYDQYHQDVFFKSDSAVVELRGINNGIYANYYFKCENDGRWYLIALEETSF